jgi:hypothetical protein
MKFVGATYVIYRGIRMLHSKELALRVDPVASQGSGASLSRGDRDGTPERQDRVVLRRLSVAICLCWPAARAAVVLLGTICVSLNTLVDVVAVFAADQLFR